MQILFSQGLTPHARLGNSLLWMAQVFPVLKENGLESFCFPWACERYVGLFDDASPWINDLNFLPHADLFQQAFSVNLSAESLAVASRCLEVEYEIQNQLDPYAWQSVIYETEKSGVSILFVSGNGLNFLDLIPQFCGHQLIIIHEPFQISYPGPYFPVHQLGHLRPAQKILERAENFVLGHAPTMVRRHAFHVRRGDYRGWLNGKHFYADDFWIELARQELAAGIKLFIFTNEPEGSLCEDLSDLGCIVSAGSVEDDFARMMYMDKISGPPSTFPIVAKLIAGDCLGRQIEIDHLPALL